MAEAVGPEGSAGTGAEARVPQRTGRRGQRGWWAEGTAGAGAGAGVTERRRGPAAAGRSPEAGSGAGSGASCVRKSKECKINTTA